MYNPWWKVGCLHGCGMNGCGAGRAGSGCGLSLCGGSGYCGPEELNDGVMVVYSGRGESTYTTEETTVAAPAYPPELGTETELCVGKV